ncbi:MAG: hypothetical protein M3010_07745 [Candidatus Dormibacteraeota bacterium]|nr:hypothetical protein [Candidatus Dormibacteraeota bacterium]
MHLPGLDPAGLLLHLLTTALLHLVSTARSDIDGLLSRYLLRTVDVVGGGSFTGRSSVRSLNLGLVVAVDALLTAVVVFVFLRSMWEHSIRSRYGMRVMLPRLLGTIVLVHCSLPLMQMVIDLNNALGSVALALGGPLHASPFPWSTALADPVIAAVAASQNLFHALFAVALVIALVLLALAYVIRYALLTILVAVAPVAALCGMLPETRTYAHTWMRLFMTTVFMQALQLVILRTATVTEFGAGAGVAQTLYALATLFILLKVPGALNTAAHLETKAKTMSHDLEKSVRKAMGFGHTTHRTAA